jgi:hypothetical protein
MNVYVYADLHVHLNASPWAFSSGIIGVFPVAGV